MAMTPPSLGARIRRARERARLSQEELAALVGASSRAVGDWENNRRKPRNRLGVLEDVLGVSLEDTPEPEPTIPKNLQRAIETTDGLTEEERRAVMAAIRRTLAKERGEPEAGASGEVAELRAGPERQRPAS